MKSRRNKIFYVLMIFTINCIFTSCSSMKQMDFGKTADLQIMVLDEKNNPVPDFKMHYSKDKKGSKSQEKFTDDKGFCSFNDIPKGQYYLWGTKHGFSKIEEIPVTMRNSTDVFFCTTESKQSIFENTKKLYKSKRYEEGLKNISKLSADKNSVLEDGIQFIEYIGLVKTKTLSSKEKLKRINYLKKNSDKDFLPLIDAFEGSYGNE